MGRHATTQSGCEFRLRFVAVVVAVYLFEGVLYVCRLLGTLLRRQTGRHTRAGVRTTSIPSSARGPALACH
eukprot:6213556-Pleurochrysis_carterae.AAC.4